MRQLGVSQSVREGGGVEVCVELNENVHATYKTTVDHGPLNPKLIAFAVEQACPLGSVMCMPIVSIERAHDDDNPMAPVVVRCASQICTSGQVLVKPAL